MPSERPYGHDRAVAKDRGHWFTVATKEKRGARWIEAFAKIDDLHEAMMQARGLQAYEAGVFVRGAFIYWTTVHPDVFNSTAIKRRHDAPDETFDLPGYLAAQFPPLSWPDIVVNPVFYRWPTALRFDLRGSRANLAVARERAVALYEATFSPGDSCIVAGARFVSRQTIAVPTYDLFDFAAAHGQPLGRLAGRDEVEIKGGDPAEDGAWILEWTCHLARGFGHVRIIEGVANRDHRVEPWIDDKVYFVGVEKALLFHMYDDRGLDIVAQHRATLAPLYREFNSWLLDHDRARMRDTFGDLPG